MHLHDVFKGAGLPCFPCWVRPHRTDPTRTDKGPRVPQGVSWQDAATAPADAPWLDWSSGVVGVPIPPGVLVLDLDEYKGTTRADAEAALGCALDWDRACLQRTISGGSHYAFRVDWPARQRGAITPGLDTRAAGKGFICAGAGYTPVGPLGVLAMAPAFRDALPTLPDAARAVLEDVPDAPQREPSTASTVPLEAQALEAAEALRHVDPGCDRDRWVRVGMALKSLFHGDQDDTGRELFRQWSAGELWPHGAPANYVPDHIDWQWGTFKPTGRVGGATLYWAAMQGGWQPPRTFDAAAAFGAGAAGADTLRAVLEDIHAHGADPAHVQRLVDAIAGVQANQLQKSLLSASLSRELDDAGLMTKAVRAQLEAAVTPGGAARTREGGQVPERDGCLAAYTPMHPDLWAPFQTRGKDRTPRGTWDNFSAMLAAYGLGVQYDEVAKKISVRGPSVPCQGTLHDEAVLSYLQHLAALNDYPTGSVLPMLMMAANANTVNPVRDWVHSAPWDGCDHVGYLWQQIQLEDDEDAAFCEVLFRKWLRGAYAIGTGATSRFEFVLVLVDPSGGAGKTRFFSTLCPHELRKDSVVLDASDRDSVKVATSYWLVELGELDGTFSRSEASRLKAFLAADEDEIRLPYGRAYLKYPRRTAYMGSVNRSAFLIDDSDNRRFWPIRVKSANHLHSVNMHQVWAQAAHEVARGLTWYPDTAERDALRQRNEGHRALSRIADRLGALYPADAGPEVEVLSVTDILARAGIGQPSKADLNEAGEWLRRRGFHRVSSRGVRGYRVPSALLPAAPLQLVQS